MYYAITVVKRLYARSCALHLSHFAGFFVCVSHTHTHTHANLFCTVMIITVGEFRACTCVCVCVWKQLSNWRLSVWQYRKIANIQYTCRENTHNIQYKYIYIYYICWYVIAWERIFENIFHKHIPSRSRLSCNSKLHHHLSRTTSLWMANCHRDLFFTLNRWHFLSTDDCLWKGVGREGREGSDN